MPPPHAYMPQQPQQHFAPHEAYSQPQHYGQPRQPQSLGAMAMGGGRGYVPGASVAQHQQGRGAGRGVALTIPAWMKQ
jgi:hypothetical protein